MDADRFDSFSRAFARVITRRRLARLLTGLLLAGMPRPVIRAGRRNHARDDDHGSSHRRHRRKARHDPGGDKANRHGKGKSRHRRSGSPPSGGCTAHSQCGANQICDAGTCRACTVCHPPGACAYDAVQDAIDDVSLSTIVICPGTYGEARIFRTVNLLGAGEDGPYATILQGHAGGGTSDALNIESGVQDVSVRALRVLGAEGAGGVTNLGGLTMQDCTLTGAKNSPGLGGLANAGTAVLTGCTIAGNEAFPFPIAAGGIVNSGTLMLRNCLIDGNTGLGTAPGGIMNGVVTFPAGESFPGNLTLDRTIVRGNNGRIGGIYNQLGEVRLINGSEVTGSTGVPGHGIANGSGPDSARLSLDASSVTANQGAGISNEPGNTVELHNGSEVSGNTGPNCFGSGYDIDASSTCAT